MRLRRRLAKYPFFACGNLIAPSQPLLLAKAQLACHCALGKNHEKYEWVDLKKFKPEEYFTGGWLKGVKEFQELHNSSR